MLFCIVFYGRPSGWSYTICRYGKKTTSTLPTFLQGQLQEQKGHNSYLNIKSTGVKVPSTSSLSVYTKVLAHHNLNDIRNWASLIGLLLRICWCLLSVFLIYCSDEWKKLVNLIYCFQVLFRMNFRIIFFLMKIMENTPSADSAASRDSLSSQTATSVLFFSPHFIDDTLNTRAECVRDSLICKNYMFLAKIYALTSMGIQLVPSPLQGNCGYGRYTILTILTYIKGQLRV